MITTRLRGSLYMLLLCALGFTIPAVADEQKKSGKQLFESYCSVCHSLEPPPKLAPPVRGIVMHYQADVSSKEEFAKEISKFVRDPAKQHPKLPGAVTRFGKMPTFPYSDEELQTIARWMWEQVVPIREPN